jgi:hypothetical protein
MYSLSGTYSTSENMLDNKEIALRVSRHAGSVMRDIESSTVRGAA